MNPALTQQVGQQLNAFYEQITTVLLDTNSYSQAVQINNVAKFLSFVNSSLERPYVRIFHVYHFLYSEETFSERMYPFCYLDQSTKTKIEIAFLQSVWIMEGLCGYEPESAKV